METKMAFLNAAYCRDSFLNFNKDFISDLEIDIRDFNVDDDIRSATQLGKSKSLNLSVLELEVDEGAQNRRVAITQSAFKLMRRHLIRNALVAFCYNDGDWRLSLLTSSLRLDDKGNVIKEESSPRRYSYLVGPTAKIKTPYKFLIEKGKVTDFTDLLDRFSVEVVNRQFYSSIAELFTKLVGGNRNGTSYPGLLNINNNNIISNQERQEFAVRLIGRIVFCWFLKEKHSENGKSLMVNELMSLDAISNNTDYYQQILEPMFFELLNKPINERAQQYRTELFDSVAYLNGGLFSPQDTDYYNRDASNISISNSWFNELFEVFNQYNFTVDENTSFDVDLSIDPEMLGRIFENLLAEIDPHTGETARKKTGSFYTPREIVDYMVDNSLLVFLKDKTSINESRLKALISYGKDDDGVYPLDEEEKRRVVDAIDSLTILDPACGSGAFPIGILQKVVYILQQADENGSLWFERQIKNIPSYEMRNDLKRKYEKENYDYIRKLGVIRQSIFGVDIQTIATEIAKLRCFLTLIIEEDVDDSKDNRGIHPLPNLDFKFVTANSLIWLPEDVHSAQGSLLEDTGQIDELKDIRNKYFTAPADERQQLRGRFAELQTEMYDKRIDLFAGSVSTRYNKLMRWKPFKNAPTDWFDPDWMFGVDKFDIVIANPPYIHLEDIKGDARILYESLKYATYENRGDIYALFFERGIKLLKEHGVLTYITSNKWMRAGYGESLRDYFVRNTNPLQIIDLGGGVFESATVDTDILILKKEPYDGKTVAVAANSELNTKNIAEFVRKSAIKYKFKEEESWIILSPIEQSIKNKIERFGTPLKDWDVKINYGIKTGCNEAFIIGESDRNKMLASCKNEEERLKTAKLIRPILRGRDIRRNGYDWAGLYIILTHNGYVNEAGNYTNRIDINHFPALKEWFDNGNWNTKSEKGSNQKRLAARTDKGNTPYNLRDCTYMDDFSQQKIIYPETTQSARFYYDLEGYMAEKTCFIMTGKYLKYISSTLSSTIFEFAYKRLFSSIALGENGYQYNKHALEKLPIASTDIDKTLSEIEIKEIYQLTDEEMNFISSSVNS